MTTEGVVIVVSILLAFGIDAWWEGHGERLQEDRFLSALQREATANGERLAQVEAEHITRMAAFDDFQDASASELSDMGEDVAQQMLSRILFVTTINLRDEVVQRADVTLVRDAALRDAIGRWRSLADDVDEDAPGMASSVFDALHRARVLSPEIQVPPSSDASASSALAALRGDSVYMADRMLVQLAIRINRTKIAALREQNEALLVLLAQLSN